jgi:8-oxo-dGTP pyrophosphatase MutT (NUDIX family)
MDKAAVGVPPIVTPRQASTLVVARDSPGPGGGGIEVLMLQRNLEASFAPGAYVFPGGAIGDTDRGGAAYALCSGRSDADASRLLGVPRDGLAWFVAALRECYEECGVLLAYERGAEVVAAAPGGIGDARLERQRDRLNSGEIGFVELMDAEGLRLAVDRIEYFSHWITPEAAPRRFDTRFFVAAVPSDQSARHDATETIDSVWVRPAEALARAGRGEIFVMFPTARHLEALQGFRTSEELIVAARRAALGGDIRVQLPQVVTAYGRRRIVLDGRTYPDEAD